MDRDSGIPEEWTRRLSRYLRRKTGPEAEDLLQEVFLAFYARWNLGEVFEDGLAWLFRTACRKVVDSYRRRGRDRAAGMANGGTDLDGRDVWELADRQASTPEELMEREELRQAILDGLEALPDDQREVLVLHEVEGLDFREIQERTGAPLNTLLSRKRYALQKLRKHVEKFLGEGKEA